ncbi:tbc1 domain family member 12 [Limosa lapponica baueri]|uniref:Tbc1 domain family member 12 n=1 Tax=Limosa lapponica baueri TaxID=1758121 RepID=A0A2I0TH00_LIMLA|nr:tbc1 domain family member 12 [Limosa lapponica baueri]
MGQGFKGGELKAWERARVETTSEDTEYEARTGRMYKPPPPSARRKNIEFEPLSTTALILEDRPANLPAKSVEEALRHRQEYDEMVAEAKKRDAVASVADREASLELIKLDISRTFPSLYIFQKVQGMSFIAAVLILNLEEADAFIAFANLLNKPCQLAFFRVDHSMMLKYFAAFEVFFEENLPKLFLHFKSYSLTPDIYLIDW